MSSLQKGQLDNELQEALDNKEFLEMMDLLKGAPDIEIASSMADVSEMDQVEGGRGENGEADSSSEGDSK